MTREDPGAYIIVRCIMSYAASIILAKKSRHMHLPRLTFRESFITAAPRVSQPFANKFTIAPESVRCHRYVNENENVLSEKDCF